MQIKLELTLDCPRHLTKAELKEFENLRSIQFLRKSEQITILDAELISTTRMLRDPS